MAIIDIRLPVLHDLQQEVKDHPARFKVLACGRRVGKTELGKDILIDNALDGKPYAYFTLTYKNVREMWGRVKDAAFPVITHMNLTERRIEFLGGGSIDFWSLQSADTTRGFAYAGAVIDEAAQIADLGTAWNEAIRPTLTDHQGWALFLSTPKGRDFFWQLYQRGIDRAAWPHWMSWQRPTADNPFIDAEEIEAARQELPQRAFEQEYLAQFLADGGAVFRNLAACTTVSDGTPPNPRGRYIFGVDWGKSNDFTAIAIIDTERRECVHIERFNEIGWTLQRGRLAALAGKWQPYRIIAETNSMGDPNVEALHREGLPVRGFQTTAQSKPPLIESLVLAFEREELHIVNDPVLVGELQAYTMDRLPSGRFRYSAPSGMHDDTVIALALAWHGIINRRGGGNL